MNGQTEHLLRKNVIESIAKHDSAVFYSTGDFCFCLLCGLDRWLTGRREREREKKESDGQQEWDVLCS